jgi:hypothetical protein
LVLKLQGQSHWSEASYMFNTQVCHDMYWGWR